MEKSKKLLLIECIRQSQKFDKPSYYLHCHCKKVNYFWSNTFGKVKNLTKREFREFFLWKKCTQLLLIKRIRQSQNFDKPSYYLHCHCKRVNYLWLNAFGKFKILTNLPTTFIVTVKRSTTFDQTHSAKSKILTNLPSACIVTLKRSTTFDQMHLTKSKILTNLPSAFIVTVKRSTTYDRTHLAKSKILTNLPTTFIVTVKSSTTFNQTHSSK